MSYDSWLKAKLQSENPFSNCAEWTEEAVRLFPDLVRIRGQVLLSNGLFRDHWWLTDGPDGGILDPTASQFQQDYYGGSSTKILKYFPRDESEPEPIGRCCNCGEYCYEGSPSSEICSDSCWSSYHAYLMGGRL